MDYEKYDKEYQEQSPSSQRVWIEITNDYDRLVKDSKVALFTEGVD